MADNNQTGAVGAGVLGAAIGAAAGVAVTKIMSDPQMKSKATDAFQKAKQYALDTVQQMKSKAQDMKSMADDSAEDMVTESKKIGRTVVRGAKAL